MRNIGFAVLFFLQACARPPAEYLRGEKERQDLNTDATCETFKTNEKDAKNEIPERWLNERFNLYWIGKSNSVINFWSYKADIHFEITRAPLSLVRIGDDNSPRLICNDSMESATLCIQYFDLILQKLRSLKKHAEVSTLLSSGKEKTFSCTRNFLEIKIAQLTKGMKPINNPGDPGTKDRFLGKPRLGDKF